MAASPDQLADEVRMRREAIDEDLERIRAGLRRADPRRLPPEWWASRVLPVIAALAGLWLVKNRWRGHRRARS